MHRRDAQWPALSRLFPPLPGSRQVFVLHADLVQTSCSVALPRCQYEGERHLLNRWALQQGDDGLRDCRAQENQHSLDDIETHIVEKHS